MVKRNGVPLVKAVAVISVFVLGYSLAAPKAVRPEIPGDTGAHQIMNEVSVIQNAEASTVKTDVGSIMYGVDNHAINLVLDLNLPRHPKVQIKFMGEEDHGVLFGSMISNLKVGHVEEETTFVADHNGLVLWTQLPVRLLGSGNEGRIEITDQETGKVIVNQKLTFRLSF